MAINIVPYSERWIPAVIEFNARLQAAGVASRFPESHIPKWLPRSESRSIYQEFFLAVDGDCVRGGYILKHQEFFLNGQTRSIGNYQLPLSEGVINKTYAAVGLQLLSHALSRQPLLFCLGIGGFREPLTKMLVAMGWDVYPVPFCARIIRPFTFFREIAHLRKTAARRLLLDLAACSGAGWCAVKLQQTVAARRRPRHEHLTVERVGHFDAWADELWEANKGKYLMSAVRSAGVLNILYPHTDPRFITLKVSDDKRVIGWVVLLATRMAHHKHFGRMNLGSIVDGLGAPGRESEIVAVADRWLVNEGVDLIVSNQARREWSAALHQCGHFQGPSNFLLAVSKSLSVELGTLEHNMDRIHVNRGDGDGPIHL